MEVFSKGKITITLFILSIFILSLSGSLWAKPNTLVRDEIPDQYKWRFSDIYPNWEAWEADLARIQTLMDEYIGFKGTLSQGPEHLVKVFKMDDEMGKMSYLLYRYPALMRAVDTRNNEISSKLQQVMIVFQKFGTATSWFSPEMLEIPWETMKKWLDETPELAPYRYGIENLYRLQEHVYDEDTEKMLSFMNPFEGTPVSIYSMLSTSDIQFPDIVLSNGDTVTLTRGTYGNILTTNRNQEDRKKAFEEHYKVYNDNVNTYAAIYNSVLQRDWADAQVRKYTSCLEDYLNGDNVPLGVYTTLVETVKKNTQPLRRYMELRKKFLGLESYHLYDGAVPLVDIDRTYEYDSITDWIVESVAPLGKEYQNKMKEVFKGGWVDVYENEGKESGAFSANVYGVHPFILMNYTETLDNVFTLAHEAGHSMHSILSMENQPFSTHGYTIFVAEVASTMNEALFLEYMLDRAKDPKERAALLQQSIENIIGTFYTQAQFADFELQAHELVENGMPVTADILKELYIGIDEEYYGDAVTIDEMYNIAWSRISHFFEAPFYVYKYATCFASSAKLFKEITSDDKNIRKDALDRYLTLLKSGGNDYPMEQLRKAGVDLTDPATFEAVIAQLNSLIDRFEAELNKIES